LIPQTGRRVCHLGDPDLYKSCVPCPRAHLRVLGLPITILQCIIHYLGYALGRFARRKHRQGPLASIPTSQQPQAKLTHSGERRSTRKESIQARDQRTVHNQWTWTIAIGLTLCKGCTIVPARIEPGGSEPPETLPYGWSPSKWIVPSCISESGAAPAAELILPASVPRSCGTLPRPRWGEVF
jgi:hypothetical protein